MRVSIYHNILWSKYKGVVFSQVHALSRLNGITTSFIQIAETEEARVALGGVDLSYHNYPFRLLFKGAYSDSSRWQRSVALAKDLLKYPCDLVVIPGYHRLEHWAMLLTCILLRRKRAVFCDSTKYDQPKEILKEFGKRWFFSWCNGFFCYGVRSKEYLQSYGIDESKINFRCQVAALPHDYDPAAVLRNYESAPQRDVDAPRFIYVGRLSPEKGIEDLIRAFRNVLAAHPRAKLDIIGAGPSTPELISLISELGISGPVSMLGSKSITEIAAAFQQSTALVLPSYSEPWGLVVNEALSYGCPVVVSNRCGCVPDLVVDKVTGFAFEAGNVPALTSAMIAVSSLSTDRLVVARNCLEVIAHFNPVRAATQILDGCRRFVGKSA
jgi:glycosyltransferase involved in cell wall biosynthesis